MLAKNPRGDTENGDEIAQMRGLIQLLPILLLILMTFSSFGGGGNQVPFSLQSQGTFQIPRAIEGVRGMVKGIPYYVNSRYVSLFLPLQAIITNLFLHRLLSLIDYCHFKTV